MIARIHEAAKYIPLERLCLSPQCGFASCEIGNKLTEEQQWAKLAFVKEIAEEVWTAGKKCGMVVSTADVGSDHHILRSVFECKVIHL